MTSLGLDPDDLAACVGCGLCLPHCPTYRVTREEGLSPRGRIAGMREVQDRGTPVTARFVEMIDTCVQCRGCETACPSQVPYGRLVQGTIDSLAEAGQETSPRWIRLALRPLSNRPLLKAGSLLLAGAQRLGLPTAALGVPKLPIRQEALQATGTDVWLFTGCVMDAWYRDVHHASMQVLGALGLGVGLPGSGANCCGALHHHAGDHGAANKLAERTMTAFPGTSPILVNSAGCGAALKEYGDLLNTEAARDFSTRVFDIHEFVAERAESLPERSEAAPWSGSLAIQDPCHLRHVQRSHSAVHQLLGRYGEVRVLDDDGLCCGAGGTFSLKHPDLASGIRDRKHESIARTGATIVASANPGCAGFLAAEGTTVEHPMVLLAACIT